ncbi:MAG: L-serine ammonia-lyase, partial [Pseudomonadota bacterium]
MFVSVFDVFKIGVGPSSSHTMGPMIAAARFLDDLRGGAERIPGAGALHSLGASLHGSLAFTGKGHATDRAVILGLCGLEPATLDPAEADRIEADVRANGRVRPADLPELLFNPEKDLIFDYGPPLPGHANGLILKAFDTSGNTWHQQTYYSVGGGFVLTEAELQDQQNGAPDLGAEQTRQQVPYPFGTAAEMLAMGTRSGLSVAAMKRANEQVAHGSALDEKIDTVLDAMDACIDRGLAQDGTLPGGLNVRRRAKAIHEQLLVERGQNLAQPHQANDWLSVYAMAVNEENAAGGRVVTSPTNGAAGVVPAVLRYYRDHCIGATRGGCRDILLVAAAIGGLIKHNASIS